MTESVRRDGNRGSVLVGLAVILLLASVGMVGGYFWLSNGSEAAAAETQSPTQDTGPLEARASSLLAGEVTLTLGDRSHTVRWSELGARVDSTLLAAAAELPKEAKAPLPIAIPQELAEAALRKLSGALSVAPRDAMMDLEERKIHPAAPGVSLDIWASVAALEAAARAGSSKVELVGVAMPPNRTVEDLGIDDISHVLASFSTPFSIADKTRNYNLKLAASKLNGYILKPGELFSFNDVVGARTEKEGYKVAHVITAGEMVDGLAGGTCQISTTLHGAAFFSGIEIVRSVPHSRPSTYVTMGLDATVVYPHTDLKLRNTYDFPVVIHYRVARGQSTVEILGRERPYDKISFERVVNEEQPFDTITREDEAIPMGSMVVDQEGFPGYKLERYRRFYKDGKEVKKERWKLVYKPVTEYVRTGTNPDPNIEPPPPPKGHGPKPPKGKSYKLSQ